MSKAIPHLIAFAGRAQAGKTTAARIIRELHGHLRYRFADPLKAALSALISTAYADRWEAGGVDEQAAIRELLDGEKKERSLDTFGGKSPRQLMQSLGTDWGRGMVSETLWVDIMHRRLVRANENWLVVIDDVRFQDEIDLINFLGGVVYLIRRPGHEISGDSAQHASEQQQLDGLTGEILNDGDLGQFRDRVAAIVSGK